VIKLTAMLKRNPALSAEEFHEHWRTTHAQLIRDVPGIEKWVLRYVQRPVAIGDWVGTEGFDGVTEQWFPSMAAFLEMIVDPEYLARVRPDEAHLLDLAGCVFLLTEDDREVIAGDPR
jgi:uncharacterized protein (TIGR02118 family)